MSRLARRGFTLIEMLVVLTILMVLIAILLPVVGRAKEQANGLLCQSHVRTLTQAFLNFAADHENHLPGSILSYWNPFDRNQDHFDWLFGPYSAIGTNASGWSTDPLVSAANGTQVRFANAPQAGSIWKYVNDYQTYLCPSLTYSKPQSLTGSNGRFDYAAFSTFSGAAVKSINLQAWCVTDPGHDLAFGVPTATNWDYADGGNILGQQLTPARFFSMGGWPRLTPMPTPLICQEDPAYNIQSNLEGQHAAGDQMAHMHFGGSYYGSPDGSVNFYIENDNNFVVENTTGCYLWFGQTPKGVMCQLKEDPATSTYAWWDQQ